jgi:hypothetical protein
LQQRKTRFRNLAHIGQVGHAVYAESQDGQIAMQRRDGNDLQTFYLERPVNEARVEPGNAPVWIVAVKDVLEGALDVFHAPGVSINRNRLLLPEVKDTHVIKPQDVVSVGVRKEDGVQAVQALTQSLRPEIRRSINH